MLAIFGDSWGCGAWSDLHHVYGQGDGYFTKKFNEYFVDVANHSRGGASNTDSLHFLEDFLLENTDLANTKLLVIQTDPIRNFFSARDYVDSTIFKNYNLRTLLEFNTNLFYYKLDQLGQKYNKKINLIGGCSDLHPDYKNYTYIHSPCESWIKLLDSSHQPSIYYNTFDISTIIEDFTKDNRHVLDLLCSKLKIMEKHINGTFGNEMDSHPSHLGIDILVENIYNKLI